MQGPDQTFILPSTNNYCDIDVVSEGNSIDNSNTESKDASEDESFVTNDDENPNVGGKCPRVENFEQTERTEIDELRDWAIDNNIFHTHIDQLLHILRRKLLPDLPASSKTFLGTSSARYDIREMFDIDNIKGEFVYFGIEKGIRNILNDQIHDGDTIWIQLNIDGLPLFTSSSQQLWPILCKIFFRPDIYNPFPVGIYSGNSKPKSVDDFLQELTIELEKLMKDGIMFGDKHFKIRVQCFICDTPARTYVKCTKGHGGYYACERCTVRGKNVKLQGETKGRIVYPSKNQAERTDESFRSEQQKKHHKGKTPLLRLPFNIVTIFVLDFMHLCCIGVMKRLIEFWFKSNLNVRLSRALKVQLSQSVEDMKDRIPYEFQRKPRSLFQFAKWKATEFRFFLLYSGPIVLKRILNKSLYKHFLLLHVACRILCTQELAIRYNAYAKHCLRNFVTILKKCYGPASQIINMHNLIHLADDVINTQCHLSEITAFPFESTLGKLKKFIRSGNRPLAQLCRRAHEKYFAPTRGKVILPPEISILKSTTMDNGDLNIEKLNYKGIMITIKRPDNAIMFADQEVCIISKMYLLRTEESLQRIQLQGLIWKKNKPIFNYPCKSTILQMWQMNRRVSSKSSTHFVTTIDRKLVILSLKPTEEGSDTKRFMVPLLHS